MMTSTFHDKTQRKIVIARFLRRNSPHHYLCTWLFRALFELLLPFRHCSGCCLAKILIIGLKRWTESYRSHLYCSTVHIYRSDHHIHQFQGSSELLDCFVRVWAKRNCVVSNQEHHWRGVLTLQINRRRLQSKYLQSQLSVFLHSRKQLWSLKLKGWQTVQCTKRVICRILPHQTCRRPQLSLRQLRACVESTLIVLCKRLFVPI